jgi:hypothetical protein
MSQGLFPRIKGANSDYVYAPDVQRVVQTALLTVPALTDLARHGVPDNTITPDAWAKLAPRLEALRAQGPLPESALFKVLQQHIKDTLRQDQHPLVYSLLQHAEKTYPDDLELFLKIYLCPYGQPSTVDQVPDNQTPHCAGVNATCPADADPRKGHAMVLLHQTEGIKLVAGTDNVLTVDQAGIITLAPTQQAEVQAPLTVTGETTLAKTLTVAQQVTLQAGISVAEQSTLHAGLSVAGPTALAQTLTVAQATTLQDSLSVAGPTTLQDGLRVATQSTLLAGLSVAGPTALAQTLTVTQQATLNDSIVVAGPATFQDRLSVAGPAALAQTLTVAQPATFDDSLVVAGASTLKAGLTVEGHTTINSVNTSQVLLRLVPDGLALQVGGATLTIDANGAIHLTPRQDSKVYLSGDLEITGAVTVRLGAEADDTALTNLRTELVSLRTELTSLKQALEALSTRISGR